MGKEGQVVHGPHKKHLNSYEPSQPFLAGLAFLLSSLLLAGDPAVGLSEGLSGDECLVSAEGVSLLPVAAGLVRAGNHNIEMRPVSVGILILPDGRFHIRHENRNSAYLSYEAQGPFELSQVRGLVLGVFRLEGRGSHGGR